MKKFELKEKLLSSTKKALDMLKTHSVSDMKLQTNNKESSNIFIPYNEVKKINAQLLKMERSKAEAVQIIRDHNRCL